jgi:lipopolysaccharide/colanic/teichoic acid biosynthesis glycosyltransferase
LDFGLSLVALFLLSPLFICLILILVVVNHGKVFFVHQRPGKDGKLFNLVKFKTMNDLVDETGKLLGDNERLTKFGRFLRKSSLDELPQLLNVLLGDMSLVGPRPLLPEYLPLYSPRQARRHEVRPGMAGWAQVNGRNNLTWEEKFELDVWYVDNLSIILDMKILFLTFLKVLKQEGINYSDASTMKRFTGL